MMKTKELWEMTYDELFEEINKCTGNIIERVSSGINNNMSLVQGEAIDIAISIVKGGGYQVSVHERMPFEKKPDETEKEKATRETVNQTRLLGKAQYQTKEGASQDAFNIVETMGIQERWPTEKQFVVVMHDLDSPEYDHVVRFESDCKSDIEKNVYSLVREHGTHIKMGVLMGIPEKFYIQSLNGIDMVRYKKARNENQMFEVENPIARKNREMGNER